MHDKGMTASGLNSDQGFLKRQRIICPNRPNCGDSGVRLRGTLINTDNQLYNSLTNPLHNHV